MNLDALLPVAFLAGFFGGGHCLGMCGPIVVLFESTTSNWPRRLAYNAGRLMFYALLGAIAGAAGALLTQLTGVQSGLFALRVAAGLLVVLLGLNLIFDIRAFRYLESAGAIIWQKLSPLARHVMPMTSPPRAFAAGILWGALPCGLVYSAVAIAATSGTAYGGALTMFVFWIGTLPALLAAGASASKVNQWSRRLMLRRFAGTIMIMIGAFALAMPLMHAGGDDATDHSTHATEQR